MSQTPGISHKPLTRYLLSFLLLVSLLFATACSNSEETKVDALSFTVDPALLGERFVDASNGFSLQAPMDWASMPDSMLQQINAGIAASLEADSLRTPKLLAVYRHEVHQSHLVAARFSPEYTQSDRDSVVRSQTEGLRSRFGDKEILATPFIHRDCEFEQLLVFGDDFVVIKLFVHRGDFPMYHIEYVVPRSRYEMYSRAIESSIGSISFDS
jgi:hypothetical protein